MIGAEGVTIAPIGCSGEIEPLTSSITKTQSTGRRGVNTNVIGMIGNRDLC